MSTTYSRQHFSVRSRSPAIAPFVFFCSAPKRMQQNSFPIVILVKKERACRYSKIYAQSSELSPILLILSPGANPFAAVSALAESIGLAGKPRCTRCDALIPNLTAARVLSSHSSSWSCIFPFSGNKFRHLSIGQGMGDQAGQLVEVGYQRGFWIMLQNCHLLPGWLSTLAKLLQGRTRRNVTILAIIS